MLAACTPPRLVPAQPERWTAAPCRSRSSSSRSRRSVRSEAALLPPPPEPLLPPLPAEVSLEYLQLVGRYACHANPECLQRMVLPPLQEQLELVGRYVAAELQAGGDLQGLEPVVLKLVANHSEAAMDAVDQLTGLLRELAGIQLSVDAIVQLAQAMPAAVLRAGTGA